MLLLEGHLALLPGSHRRMPSPFPPSAAVYHAPRFGGSFPDSTAPSYKSIGTALALIRHFLRQRLGFDRIDNPEAVRKIRIK
jgi:hypothetical protein